MRRLLGQDKKDVMSTESTDGIEVEKCNINIVNGKWSKCDGTNRLFLDLFNRTKTHKQQYTFINYFILIKFKKKTQYI